MVDLLELEEGGWERGHHCRLILPAGSDVQGITAGPWIKPAVMRGQSITAGLIHGPAVMPLITAGP